MAAAGGQWPVVVVVVVVVVVGFTAPKGSRGGFGALQLADYVDGELVYAGRAGSGFTDKQLAEVSKTLRDGRRADAPCSGPIMGAKETTWVDPTLVCEVEYTEWTDEEVLRQPVFLRFRDDKPPEECVRSGGRTVERSDSRKGAAAAKRHAVSEDVEPAPPTVRPPDRQTVFSNLTKVFWPEDGYTKGDLIEYYRAIAPWLLAYLRNRPVVLTRYPDGIGGKSFFQKDAPGFAPEWIRTERMWSEDTQREIDYFICDDEASLLYVINLGAIPLHLWSSRAPTLERPDWCVLDLDPKGAPFEHVVELALAARKLCDRIGLPVLVKSSGSTGLHLLVPLGRQCTHQQSRSLGELLARCLVEQLPKIATITRQVSQRDGRVYVDYLQNGSGKLIVAPYSARPLPGAPVSVPLKWREINRTLDIRRHTIKTVPGRMRKLDEDPLAAVLELSPDLVAALGKLVEEVG